MSSDDRIQVATSFILQSPPGEINDVLNDVRVIVDDDERLEEGVLPALREYNLVQFTTVDVPGEHHQTIVSEFARVPGSDEERYLDPRSKTSFIFNHLTLEATDPQSEEPSEAESQRAALESAALSYLSSHYHDGVATIFAMSTTRFVVQIVSNKYNPSNYWAGRWRSQYEIDFESRSIQGKVLVNVHYYEQGNVQLNTSHDLSISIPAAVSSVPHISTASKIFALIEAEESRCQTSLNDSYHEMGEKTFKGLRRALPLTRQKIDWDKTMGYKLGAELTARCHVPPVEDTELIQRIRSTNTNDHDNGLAGWRCKRCKKKQAAETSIKTTAQQLIPDDNKQPPSAHTQGITFPNDQKREANNANVASASDIVGPALSVDATIQLSHNVQGTELNGHDSRYQQQQKSHTDSHLENTGVEKLDLEFLGSDHLCLPDTDSLPTTMNKRLQVKRTLQEQRHDRPGAYHDHDHDLELYSGQPAAYTKYARAPDGKKLVSREHTSRPPPRIKCINSRSTTLASERTNRSPSASLPDRDEEHLHYDSVVESPGEGSAPTKGTPTDTSSGPPVEHGDIRMKSLDDDNDDLYVTPVSQFRSSTPGPSKVQQQERVGEIDDDAGGFSRSHHDLNGQNRFTKQSPKAEAEAPLGPDWLKARHSVPSDDPWHRFCGRRSSVHGDGRRKKPKATFHVVHAAATLDEGLLEFLFFRDWFHQTQADIAT
ncbi:hypothetical protein AZE42_03629 [Rhizopogon vesiculosus]|uniref:F-actin-capping protein subunit alpha n=1 Tax=Rhizopogon vesiculosus TaxID=180088 RepID=A0A1J8QTS1_9AGAM|nr:hypothetical protein AZE42_03629 [Rhizopogon vesiculosus]